MYVDKEAYARFEDHDGRETSVSCIVNVSAAKAMEAWYEHCWLANATEELRPGKGRGGLGSLRQVPLGITEQILAVGAPEDSTSMDANSKDEVYTVLYKMVDYGVAPVQNHLGFVRFVPDLSAPVERPTTLVLWSFKNTPTRFGAFCCGGALWRLISRSALQKFLKDLVAATKK